MVANPNAFKDAESTNDSIRNAQIFTDLNLNMVRHPVTGDIAKLSNVEAVKASVRNLINTLLLFTFFYHQWFQYKMVQLVL